MPYGSWSSHRSILRRVARTLPDETDVWGALLLAVARGGVPGTSRRGWEEIMEASRGARFLHQGPDSGHKSYQPIHRLSIALSKVTAIFLLTKLFHIDNIVIVELSV
jgi:hypothetical protein